MMKMTMLTLVNMTLLPVMKKMTTRTNLVVKGQGRLVLAPVPPAVQVHRVQGHGQDHETENAPSIQGLGPGNW